MVLEDIIFSHDPAKWYCVEGGAQEIAKRVSRKLEERQQGRVQFKKRVSKMVRTDLTKEGAKDGSTEPEIAVTVQDEVEKTEDKKKKENVRYYDAVFNSAPLGAMQRMDLRGLNLNWGTKQAIRSLGYGASCKVGIKFKTMWWQDPKLKPALNIKGGVSKTDLPIRMCVYPSYNLYDSPDKEGVLLCSYSWSQEAQRMGTLINRESPKNEDDLKHLLIDNLAKLHSSNPQDYETLHQIIDDAYITHFAYDRYTDPGTTGAFAYFGPGQFRNMYPYIVRNDGVHIIIGEASSSHHAWVVGALESAVRGVYQFLYKHSATDPIASDVLARYNEDDIEAPFGPVPKEFYRPTDVKPLGPGEIPDQKHQSVMGFNAAGELLRQGVVIESVRLEQGGERLDLTAVTEEQVADFVVKK